MRILYIHQYFKTKEGFSSTRSLEFGRLLTEKGHEVTMLTSDVHLKLSKEPIVKKTILTKEYNIEGMKVIAIKNNYSNYMGKIRRICSFLLFMFLSTYQGLILKRHDIVYATSTPLTIGVPAFIISKIKRVPYVFEVRDLWPEAPIQMGFIKNKKVIKLLRWFEKKIYKHASHVIALSPGMCEGVIKAGKDQNKVTMISNSCDLEMFDETDMELPKEIGELLSTDQLIAVHPGTMGEANGLNYIVDAAEILKNNGTKDVVILLTGDGSNRPILEGLCKHKDISNIIFTGNIPKKFMPSFLSKVDITITSFKDIPILATNSPNKFFDSLAAGKPTIVNSPGWTKDLVEEHSIGFYVDPKRPNELADLLNELTKEKEVLKEMGERSRVVAEKYFDRKKLANQLENILIQEVNYDGKKGVNLEENH
ncbi:glycosyltransferase family 4 protein [Shouchella patagoniensis]|uniref:glycosyltransferase family 4 protein n=1 Tax=Shouchella patagoniensis TaxID=228576 RepID=UPI000994D0CF|nr:glycosyltransferase family 4 protein [Shouchella patagoniensis]